ncbi:hypothetical protein V8E36_003612 [Tilletia maclaganii]
MTMTRLKCFFCIILTSLCHSLPAQAQASARIESQCGRSTRQQHGIRCALTLRLRPDRLSSSTVSPTSASTSL